MSQLVLYHGNCIDGFTAAWACWKRYGDEAEYVPVHYGANGADVELPDVKGRDVVMVDFCTGRDQLLKLFDQAKSLRVLDHHKTAEAACRGLSFCTFDMERSGAGLAWDELVPMNVEWGEDWPKDNGRPWLVSYVEDRDLWRFARPNSKAVNAYISSKEQTFEAWDRMAYEESAEIAAARGEGVLGYIDRYVYEMSKQARKMAFAGVALVPVVTRRAPRRVGAVRGRLVSARRRSLPIQPTQSRRLRRERTGEVAWRRRAQERGWLHFVAAA